MKINLIPTKIINTSLFKKIKAERGETLLEVLTAITILAMIGSAVAMALGSSSKTLVHTDLNQQARNFAQYEMELLVYPVTSISGLTSTLYPGLTANISALPIPGNTGEQQVIVTITGNNSTSYSLEDYKVQ